MRHWVALPLVLVAMAASGEPYVPASDAAVLERNVPRRLAPPPGVRLDLPSAVRLASLEVDQGRKLADPRHFGRAQALLAPWWGANDPPPGVLLLRGSIRQSLHEFPEARADLRRLVEREPANAQGWLMLATVEQVTGELDSARTRCAHLESLVPPLIAAACHAGVDGARGEAGRGLARLDTTLATGGRMSVDLLAWARSLQGELAARLGKDDIAARSFALSLAFDPEDIYTRAAAADLLIDQGRYDEALRLVQGRTQADALLLRAALAAHAARAPEAEALKRQMAERIDAARRGGDRTHLREQSRFTLHVLGDAPGALALALENWTQQKEAADVRVALEAAVAAGHPEAAHEMVAFARRWNLQEPRVQKLLAGWTRA